MKTFTQNAVVGIDKNLHIYKEAVKRVRSTFCKLKITDEDIVQRFGARGQCSVDFNVHGSGGFAWSDHEDGSKGICLKPQRPSFMLMTLLHEVGHHTEHQIHPEEHNEHKIYNEMSAWDGAFKLAKKIGVEITEEMREHASECFYTYASVLGKSEQTRQWMNKRGFRDHGLANDRTNLSDTCTSMHQSPTFFYKVEFETPLKSEHLVRRAEKVLPFWAKEAWKTKGKLFK